jgi:hypothetical protein
VYGAPILNVVHETLEGVKSTRKGDYPGCFRVVSREQPSYHFAKLPQTPVTALGNTRANLALFLASFVYSGSFAASNCAPK